MTRPSGSLPSNVLLVEGVNDKHVVRHICQRLEVAISFCTKEKDSVEQVLDAFDTEVQAPEGSAGLGYPARRERQTPDARWESVRGQACASGHCRARAILSSRWHYHRWPTRACRRVADAGQPLRTGELENFVMQR